MAFDVSEALSAQPLLRLVYVSVATPENEPGEMERILKVASVHNPLTGITGLLCGSDHHYFQVLEGPERQVLELYTRVAADPRHRDPVLLSIDLVTERMFGSWSMGYVKGAPESDRTYATLLRHRQLGDTKQQVAGLLRSFLNALNDERSRAATAAPS